MNIEQFLADLEAYAARVRVYQQTADAYMQAFFLELEVYKLKLDAIMFAAHEKSKKHLDE